MTVGRYNAFNNDGCDGSAFKAKAFEKQNRWKILAAAFGAQHFAALVAGKIKAVIHHCGGNPLAEVRWTHDEKMDDHDVFVVIDVLPWNIGKFWWLHLVKNDAAADDAVVFGYLDNIVFDGAFYAAVCWKNAALKCCIGIDFFLVLKIFFKHAVELWHVIKNRFSNHPIHPLFFYYLSFYHMEQIKYMFFRQRA